MHPWMRGRFWRRRAVARRRWRRRWGRFWQQPWPTATCLREAQLPSSGLRSGAEPGTGSRRIRRVPRWASKSLLGRPALGAPGLDRRLVPVAGPLDRLLDAPAGRPQARADRMGVGADPARAPADRRHPPGGPAIPTKPDRFGAACHQARPLLPLLVRRCRGWARRHPAPEPRDPARASPPHPLADGPGRHPEGVGYRLLAPVLLLQLPGPQSPPFSPVPGRLPCWRHTPNRRTSRPSSQPTRRSVR
jgi:hypothetical protein